MPVASGPQLIEVLAKVPVLAVSRLPFAPQSVDDAVTGAEQVVDGEIVATRVAVEPYNPAGVPVEPGLETSAVVVRMEIAGAVLDAASGDRVGDRAEWVFVAWAGPSEDADAMVPEIEALIGDAGAHTNALVATRSRPGRDGVSVVGGLLERDGVVTAAALGGEDPFRKAYTSIEEARRDLRERVWQR